MHRCCNRLSGSDREPLNIATGLPSVIPIRMCRWPICQSTGRTVWCSLALILSAVHLSADASVSAEDDAQPVRRRRIILNDDGEVAVGPRVLGSDYFKYVPTAADVPT